MGKVIMERDIDGRFTIGHEAWNRGKNMSRVSLNMKKLWQNPEYRERQVKAHNHPNPAHSKRMKKIWQDPQYRRKQHSKKVGRKLSKEHKEKISKSLRRLVLPEEEMRRLYIDEKLSTIKIAKLYGVSQNTIVKRVKTHGIKLRTQSEALKGNTIARRFRDKISKAKKGKHYSPATEFKKGFKAPKIWRSLWSKIMKKKWKDITYVNKVMHARNARPNKPETKLMKIFDTNSFPFRYVGDGRVVIGGLCPDFIHSKGEKKIIELFGRIFHDPDVSFKKEIQWHRQYFGRMAYYAQFGYDCLILWDDELQDEVSIVERIRGFISE